MKNITKSIVLLISSGVLTYIGLNNEMLGISADLVMEEPFGINENNRDGIDDSNKKSGGMVIALANEYYKLTNRKIVGISASEGGTKSELWKYGTPMLNDAGKRFTTCVDWLTNNGYQIAHKYMVWCQGESDGDGSIKKDTYKENILSMFHFMESIGVEKMFLVEIGEYNGNGNKDYSIIQQTQLELARENENIILVSTKFCEMKEKGLMKDFFHYYQEAYNIVGKEAGTNIADFVLNNY